MKHVLSGILSLLLSAYPAYAANSQSQFGGVGIDGVPRADGTIIVKQLVLGGPAQVAGVRQGDIIVQIDGTQTNGNDFKFLVEHRLRGRAGTPVMLKVRHPGEPKPQTFKLVRRQLAVAGAPKKEHP